MNYKPEEPSEDDCCHSGCKNCVFDIYAEALKKFELKQFSIDRYFRYDLLSSTRFKPFILVLTQQISIDTYIYVFKPDIGKDGCIGGILPYKAGQHLSLRVDKTKLTKNCTENPGYPFITRDYSIISLSKEKKDCCFEVLIKFYKSSDTSAYIKSIELGQITYWRGPYGNFEYIPNTYTKIVILCMGTGIAPIYPIIKEILNNQKDETILKLLYSCRSSSEIILRNELNEFCAFWNFGCTYFLSEEKNMENKRHGEEFILGRIAVSNISEIIQNKIDCYFLLCGSSNYVGNMKCNLKSLNIDKTRIYAF